MAGVRPTLVLLPGMDGTGALFEPLIVELGDAVKVVRVQYPPDQPLGYNALSAIASQALPAGERFVLLGESFSGPIAITLAAQAPDGLAGLILCCSFARNPRPGLRALARIAGLLPPRLLPDALLRYCLLGRFSTPALVAMLRNALRDVSAAVLAGRMQAVMEVDVTAALRAVRVPILDLRATHDALVPSASAALVAATAAQVRVQVIDGPHCLLQASPRAAASAVRELLMATARR